MKFNQSRHAMKQIHRHNTDRKINLMWIFVICLFKILCLYYSDLDFHQQQTATLNKALNLCGCVYSFLLTNTDLNLCCNAGKFFIFHFVFVEINLYKSCPSKFEDLLILVALPSLEFSQVISYAFKIINKDIICIKPNGLFITNILD